MYIELLSKRKRILLLFSITPYPDKHRKSLYLWIGTYSVSMHLMIYIAGCRIALIIHNPWYRVYSWVGYFAKTLTYEHGKFIVSNSGDNRKYQKQESD